MDTGHSKNRLLLVDGDPKSLRVLEVSLKKAGFGVSTASNGAQALAAMAAGPIPDLIISDTDLDGTDGFELCHQIKSKPAWAKIPFLFVSGRKSIEDKIRGLELGVDDYLTKPVYIREIGIRVRTALQRAERERLESRRDTRTRFSGDLADIGVVDLVQTIDLNRKSGIVHIADREGRRGAVFFRDGRVIDAEVGRLAGTEAMYRLFSWSEGRFEVEFKPIRRRDVVEMPTAALLMEGMRRLDEWTRLLESLPGLDKTVEVDYRVLADQLADLPDEVNGLLRLCDGSRSLLAVIDDSDYPDLEALTVASSLFAQHILYVREFGAHESESSGELARWLEEGGALAEDTADPAAQDRAQGKRTLVGVGVDALTSRGEVVATPDVRTFTGEFAPPPLQSPSPHRIADEPIPQAIPVKESNTLRLAAPVIPVPSDLNAPIVRDEAAPELRAGQDFEPSDPFSLSTMAAEGELEQLPGDTPRKPGALTDTLRGIPVPGEQGTITEDEQIPGIPADTAALFPIPSAQSRATAIEFAAPARVAAMLDEPSADARHETDSCGWPQEPEDQERQDSDESPADTPSALPEERLEDVEDAATHNGDALNHHGDAPARSPRRETYVLRNRLQPARQSRLVPILFSLGLILGAGLLVWQLRSGGTKQAAPAADPAAANESALAAGEVTNQAVALQLPALPDAGPALLVQADAQPVGRGKAVAQPSKSPEAPAPAGESESVKRCRKLGAGSRSKPASVVAACQAALQADPSATDVMVLLARVELDRGNASQARSWAKKAVQSKPDFADAYVYLGGAEQEVGNDNEAKAAYKKYLELAPSGRYARELRAVLNGL